MDTLSPPTLPTRAFTDPELAWAYVVEIYRRNTGFIHEQLLELTRGSVPPGF